MPFSLFSDPLLVNSLSTLPDGDRLGASAIYKANVPTPSFRNLIFARKQFTMTSYSQQILDQFEVVRRERDAAVRELSRAQETITVLEAEVTAIKYHGDLAYAKVADEQGMSKRQIERSPPEVKLTSATLWIGDIWMCTLENINILRPAEEAWRMNFANPQQAIVLATEALKTNLVKKERLRCKLFMSAIQFSAGSLEQACAMANDCIRECGTDPRYKNVAGIAYYIRGRIFMEMKLYSNAHWDFSMAVFTEGYHEQVKKWQGYCASRMLEEEGRETGEEDVASTSGDSHY